MRRRIVWLCVLAIAPVLHAAQPAALVPVKQEMLDGSRLVLKAAGVSLDRPASGWQWMTYAGGSDRNYLCTNTTSGMAFLAAIGQLHGDFTDHQPQSLLDNARKALAARGGKQENGEFKWQELPGAKKCVRVSFNEVDQAGKKTLVVIYFAQTIGEVSLKLSYTGAGAAEPDAFKQMVQSLKMLPDAAK
jgi:hypothetical protein